MRTLRIEDIKQNPWNVMKYPLPEFPSRLLLLLAQVAATCLRQIAEETMAELEATAPRTKLITPEQHVAIKDWRRAHRKIGEICYLLRDEFGVAIFDFTMSRKTKFK